MFPAWAAENLHHDYSEQEYLLNIPNSRGSWCCRFLSPNKIKTITSDSAKSYILSPKHKNSSQQVTNFESFEQIEVSSGTWLAKSIYFGSRSRSSTLLQIPRGSLFRCHRPVVHRDDGRLRLGHLRKHQGNAGPSLFFLHLSSYLLRGYSMVTWAL